MHGQSTVKLTEVCGDSWPEEGVAPMFCASLEQRVLLSQMQKEPPYDGVFRRWVGERASFFILERWLDRREAEKQIIMGSDLCSLLGNVSID